MTNKVVIGERFGRWTVVREEPHIRGARRVWCRCECGVERSLVITVLRLGRSKSCGCRPAPIKPGDRFGRWTVVAPAEPAIYGKKKYARVSCRCDENYILNVGAENGDTSRDRPAIGATSKMEGRHG